MVLVEALFVIAEHPGITAEVYLELAKVKNPNARPNVLSDLVNYDLIRRRVEPTNFYRINSGCAPPKVVHYLTDLGYEVYEYWKRQLSKTVHAPV